jgi:hypothetical protein
MQPQNFFPSWMNYHIRQVSICGCQDPFMHFEAAQIESLAHSEYISLLGLSVTGIGQLPIHCCHQIRIGFIII